MGLSTSKPIYDTVAKEINSLRDKANIIYDRFQNAIYEDDDLSLPYSAIRDMEHIKHRIGSMYSKANAETKSKKK